MALGNLHHMALFVLASCYRVRERTPFFSSCWRRRLTRLHEAERLEVLNRTARMLLFQSNGTPMQSNRSSYPLPMSWLYSPVSMLVVCFFGSKSGHAESVARIHLQYLILVDFPPFPESKKSRLALSYCHEIRYLQGWAYRRRYGAGDDMNRLSFLPVFETTLNILISRISLVVYIEGIVGSDAGR